MNRATADNQSAQAEDEGLEPTKEWVKDLVDEIIAEEFASPDLELAWLDEDTDAAQAEAQLEARVKLGAVTLNEMRDALGLDPFATLAADRPMVLTATGYVPIEAGVGGEASSPAANQNGQNPNGHTAPTVQKYSPDQPRVPVGNPDGGQWTSGGAADFAVDVDNSNDADGYADAANESRKPDPSNIQVAAARGLPCDGFSGGCQSGGSYGTNAMYRIRGRNLCRNCAVKMLGIEDEPSNEQILTLDPFSIQGK